jgi:hypothetical protein
LKFKKCTIDIQTATNLTMSDTTQTQVTAQTNTKQPKKLANIKPSEYTSGRVTCLAPETKNSKAGEYKQIQLRYNYAEDPVNSTDLDYPFVEAPELECPFGISSKENEKTNKLEYSMSWEIDEQNPEHMAFVNCILGLRAASAYIVEQMR